MGKMYEKVIVFVAVPVVAPNEAMIYSIHEAMETPSIDVVCYFCYLACYQCHFVRLDGRDVISYDALGQMC